MATSAGLVQAHRCQVRGGELSDLAMQTREEHCTGVDLAYDALSHGMAVYVRESDMEDLRKRLIVGRVKTT